MNRGGNITSIGFISNSIFRNWTSPKGKTPLWRIFAEWISYLTGDWVTSNFYTNSWTATLVERGRCQCGLKVRTLLLESVTQLDIIKITASSCSGLHLQLIIRFHNPFSQLECIYLQKTCLVLREKFISVFQDNWNTNKRRKWWNVLPDLVLQENLSRTFRMCGFRKNKDLCRFPFKWKICSFACLCSHGICYL